MIEELKPCPFCGGKAEITKHDNMPVLKWFGYFSEHYYNVGCIHHCTIRSGYRTPEEAAEAWNRRAQS